MGFVVFLSVEESLLSSNGSYVHLVPLFWRARSRAGIRSAAPGRRGVREESAVGVDVGPFCLRGSWGCLDCCELEVEGYVGEPTLVRGVRLLLAVWDEAFIAADGSGPLRTDEAVLA
jgi:hypothetical protein